MTLQQVSDDLARSLRDVREQSRLLGDDLRNVNRAGLGNLQNLLRDATQNSTTTRKSTHSIVLAELEQLLRQELIPGIGSIFNSLRPASAGAAPRNADLSGLNVVIHNNAGVAIQAQERRDAFDQRMLEITIDQMVANSLISGRQTSGVMRSLFGLMPSLIGR